MKERGSGGGSSSSRAVALLALLGVLEACDALAVGTDHACVLLDDSSVRCFGLNQYGQLGYGDTDARGQSPATMGDSLAPVDLGVGAVVIDMSAGSDHTCAVLESGDVKCWGKNSHGQLGLGDTENRGDGAYEMGYHLPAVPLGVNRTAVAVSAEGDRTCVLLDSGNVRCWGDAEFGGLGSGDETNTGGGGTTPIADVDLGGARVAAIGEGPCAVLEDGGTLKCWGKGYYGKNGQGTAENLGDGPGEMGDALPAVPLGDGRLAYSVAGGRDYNCAVLQDGDLKCWGRGEGGQLGTQHIHTMGDDPDEMGDNLPTVDLGAGETVLQVTAGSQHTCAVLGSGGVKCWGSGFFGNLGLGSFRARGHHPDTMGDALPFVDLGTNRTALSVAAGGERTCAILDDGSLKCWGRNAGGQLGLGDLDPRGVGPSQMGDLLPAVALGTGRTAVSLASSALPGVVPTLSPTPAEFSHSGTPAPATAVFVTAAPTASVGSESSAAPTAAATAAATAEATRSPVSAPLTPAPTAAVVMAEATEDRGDGVGGDESGLFGTGVSTTLAVSVSAPVAVMLLLGCLFCAAKRKRHGGAAAAVGSRLKARVASRHASFRSGAHVGGNSVGGASGVAENV